MIALHSCFMHTSSRWKAITSRVVHTRTDTQSFENIKYTNIRLNGIKNTHDLYNYMY